MSVVEVRLWGVKVGYIAYSPGQTEISTFEYDEDFMKMGVQISPITMKYPPQIHTFDNINFHTFRGLAGCFADSLPDKFGNQLIDMFMADKKIPQDQITALDRLLYVGTRGVGALEYHPAQKFQSNSTQSIALDIHSLANLAQLVITQKEKLSQKLSDTHTRSEALNMIRIGSSAGGARSKALVATNKEGKIFDGTIDHGVDYDYWLLKFDSDQNADRDAKDPKGMTIVEYILMSS